MSAVERMIAFHLERLKDKNPAVRLKSIDELVLLDAVSALEALENIYRHDPDESVRLAAQKAGRAIYLKSKGRDDKGGSGS
ncbi:MAG: HEAT repeat domain-containing protein [Chloroflexi bacterium]|nr:MAG: HEAT repeat domain-containing protein [Chloroflexota bacterium]